jgi:hypothetical protein
MKNDIQEKMLKAVANGQLIRGIKLLRQIDNISLKEAKEKIEALSRSMQGGNDKNLYVEAKKDQMTPRVHSHIPARKEKYNLETSLPTEAFLFMQKGEVKEAIRVLKEVKGLNQSAASNLAIAFYKKHPEYESKEIKSLMNNLFTSKSSSGRKKNNSKVGNFIFFVIVVIFIFSFMNS